MLCSVHPDNGALCVAVTPRTFGENRDDTPLASIRVIGGPVKNLTLKEKETTEEVCCVDVDKSKLDDVRRCMLCPL